MNSKTRGQQSMAALGGEFSQRICGEKKTKKNTFFQKRTGEIAENTGSDPKNEPERTGKRSGEVIENTYLWKKRTENEPENKAGHVAENKQQPKTNAQRAALFVTVVKPAF